MTWSAQQRYRDRAGQAFPGAEMAAAQAVGGAPGGSTGGARHGSTPDLNTGTSQEGRQAAGAGADEEASGAAASRATITLTGTWEDLGVTVEFDPPVQEGVDLPAPHEVAHAILRWLQLNVGEVTEARVDGEKIEI